MTQVSFWPSLAQMMGQGDRACYTGTDTDVPLSLAQTAWEGNRACWTRTVALDAQFRVASHPATSANQTTTADIPCENLQGKRPGVELSAEPSTTAECDVWVCGKQMHVRSTSGRLPPNLFKLFVLIFFFYKKYKGCCNRSSMQCIAILNTSSVPQFHLAVSRLGRA